MLVPLLLAASLAAPLAVPLATATSSTATVLANRTAFNQPCVNFTSTAPDRLAAQASSALRAFGWWLTKWSAHSSTKVKRFDRLRQSARSMCIRMAITIGMRRREDDRLVFALMVANVVTRQR